VYNKQSCARTDLKMGLDNSSTQCVHHAHHATFYLKK